MSNAELAELAEAAFVWAGAVSFSAIAISLAVVAVMAIWRIFHD